MGFFPYSLGKQVQATYMVSKGRKLVCFGGILTSVCVVATMFIVVATHSETDRDFELPKCTEQGLIMIQIDTITYSTHQLHFRIINNTYHRLSFSIGQIELLIAEDGHWIYIESRPANSPTSRHLHDLAIPTHNVFPNSSITVSRPSHADYIDLYRLFSPLQSGEYKMILWVYKHEANEQLPIVGCFTLP